MAAEVPVLAFGAAAVPETLGGAGIAFDQKHFAFLSELVVEVSESPELRQRLLAGQARRLEHFSAENSQRALAQALGERGGSSPPALHPEARSARAWRIVVQRYGEVTGGAERHAQQLAEHLAPHFELTLLTTTAKNHLTWENAFPPGPDEVDGLPVLRFPVTRTRNIRPFNALSRAVFDKPNERLREEHWVAEQGPLCPGLLSHLETARDAYDGFIFFTYLYAPTVWGLPMVADRALLVPTAHDEPPIRFGVYGTSSSGPGRSCATRPRRSPSSSASIRSMRAPASSAWEWIGPRPSPPASERSTACTGPTCSTWGGWRRERASPSCSRTTGR